MEAQSELGGSFYRAYLRTGFYRWRISGKPPETLQATIMDAWKGAPDVGQLLLEGRYRSGGKIVEIGENPWTNQSVDDDTTYDLYRFDWLRDLRDLGGDAARRRARDLIDSWLEMFDRWDPMAWDLPVLGARLNALSVCQGFAIESANDAFRTRVLSSMIAQRNHLLRQIKKVPDTLSGLSAIQGAISSGVALGLSIESMAAVLGRLDMLLESQILEDGCHRSRAPDMQAELLARLIDIRAAMRAAGNGESPRIDEFVQRTTPVLRMFRHGDGGLALFNGSNMVENWLLDTLLARSEVPSKTAPSAPEGGFHRLTAGRTVAILDTGVPNNRDGRAHASTLACEISVGKERLIVNCGAALSDPRWTDVMRASAAHSTLVIDDTNSCEILTDGAIGRGPQKVTLERWEADGASWIEAEHDGYLASYGLLHSRRLHLAAGGDDIRGEDVLTYTGAPGKQPRMAAIRFHLHPSLSASMAQNGMSVLVRTPSKGGWRFRFSGGVLALNDSVYFGEDGRLQKSMQIVVNMPLDHIRTHGKIASKWALRREDSKAG